MVNTTLLAMRQQAFELVKQLNATALELPAGLAELTGTLRGEQVTMVSKAWRAENYRLIRYTSLYCKNRIETFNFVIYPHHTYDAPIFASDWVLLGDKLRIAVMDAMPLFPNEDNYHKKWVTPFSPLQEKSTLLAPVFERKLSWSTRYLGASACLATGISIEGLPALAKLWFQYLQQYRVLTAQMTPVSVARQQQITAWHQSYNKKHREVEDQRNPYMLYFGQELGQRYNREFLFSDTFGELELAKR